MARFEETQDEKGKGEEQDTGKGEEQDTGKGEEQDTGKDEEQDAGKDEEQDDGKGEEQNDEFIDSFDYGGMIDDNDVIPVGDKKLKFGDAKKLIDNAEKNKDLLDAIEKNPALKEQLLKGVKDPKSQPQQGQQLTQEQKIMVGLLKREYVREWDRIKDKYDLVESNEVFAKMMSEPNQEPGNLEIVAKKLQSFFERKLDAKEKSRIKNRERANETNFEGANEVRASGKKDDSEELEIGNIDHIEKSIRSYKR